MGGLQNVRKACLPEVLFWRSSGNVPFLQYGSAKEVAMRLNKKLAAMYERWFGERWRYESLGRV